MFCGSYAAAISPRSRGGPPSRGPDRGDGTALRVLENYRQGLSIGLIDLVNILQPQIICLGGGISNADDDLLLTPLRELVKKGLL